MQIHRIHGRDLRDALERAGRVHGTDAVVLGHEQVAGGVTVAVTGRRPGRAPEARARSEAPPAVRRAAPRVPGLADVERALARSGTSPGLIAAVLAEIERGEARGAYALDRAAQILGARASVAPSPRVTRGEGGPCVLAFVGARGSGVTTSVTKLAGRLVRSRRRVALVSLRSPGASGPPELEKYARVLQVPVDAVHGADELRTVLERSRGCEAVLLDGTGVAGRDVALLRELRALGPRPRLEVYLTLAASAYPEELAAQASAYAAAEPSGLLLTHLDRTRAPAPALEQALDSGCPLAFFCDGPQVSGHLRRPTPELVADLFLRGRLS